MPISSGIITAGKYIFLSLVLTGAGFLITTMTVVERRMVEPLEDLVYEPQISTISDEIFDKSFNRCLTHPTYPVCLMSANREISLHRPLSYESRMPSADTQMEYRKLPIINALREFSRLARSLRLRPVLLEASVLFCVLSVYAKIKLLLQGFRLHGTRNFITFGISEEEGKVLDQESSLMLALASGFEVSRIRRWLVRQEISTVHFFFQHQESTLHLVVLIARQNYLWHTSHDHFLLQDPNFSKEAIYENFTFVPLKTQKMEFYLPSDPLYFLLQTQISEFRKCSLPDEAPFHLHPNLTSEQLRRRTQVAIQEIKSFLRTFYIPFWLWSDTLKGWREACNIFYITSELNLAATTLKNMNLSEVLQDNPYLQYSWSDDQGQKSVLDCHGLTVNMFVTDEDGSSFQSNGKVSPDSRVYPKFPLCTTVVFAIRVQVPCD